MGNHNTTIFQSNHNDSFERSFPRINKQKREGTIPSSERNASEQTRNEHTSSINDMMTEPSITEQQEEDMEFTTDLFRLVKEQSQMDENEKKSGLPFGIILIGGCDSGKTTLWNQWKFQSNTMVTLSQTERMEFGNTLMTYLITCMKRLIYYAKNNTSSLKGSTLLHDASSTNYSHTTETASLQDLYIRHAPVIDMLLTQLDQCQQHAEIINNISEQDFRIDNCLNDTFRLLPFESLFVNPLSKNKLQSLWTNHEFLCQLCALFREPVISQIYYHKKYSSMNDTSNNESFEQLQEEKNINSSCGIVHELLYGNYLHFFLQHEEELLKLSNFLNTSSSRKSLTLHSQNMTLFQEHTDSPRNELPNIRELVLKSKNITTAIHSLKFQYSQRSICTRVIRVIERRKKQLRKATSVVDQATPLAPLSKQESSTAEEQPSTTGLPSVVSIGSIKIPKLDLSQANNTASPMNESKGLTLLLPKSARGGSGPTSSTLTSRVNSFERLSQEEESEWNTTNSCTTTSRVPTTRKSSNVVAQKLMEMVRKRSNSNNSSSSNNGVSTSPKSPSPIMSMALGHACSSPRSQFSSSNIAPMSPTSQTSSITKVIMQESTAPLDEMEKRKLQKFTMIDTPGLASQRDLVIMTLNASTKPTSTFLLKSVVFVFSLADFDLPCLDSSEFKSRLEESLSLFEKTMTLASLKERRKILLMTHVDIFIQRIAHLENDERVQLMKAITFNAGQHCSEEEPDNLIRLCFDWILSQFKNIEERRNGSHKYALEVYAIDLMNEKQVKDFTFALTIKDGILKQAPQLQVVTVFTCSSLRGVECEENRKLLVCLRNHSFVDVEFNIATK
ncbi:hypothetical protein C9374_007047 [Naegleria lovaniensis]|uniref:Uncharacterized protein n=1 Tax=Naegleria lovaniensis TaxID=51637 RepID=A0AA88KRR2_NAELO|nr:uncharacterized protein C9374_007047 [Naegleria lovaniensis]KAG2393516.1 hypothetical protein C9374_007047 [Naegleria lovaniensis]